MNSRGAQTPGIARETHLPRVAPCGRPARIVMRQVLGPRPPLWGNRGSNRGLTFNHVPIAVRLRLGNSELSERYFASNLPAPIQPAHTNL